MQNLKRWSFGLSIGMFLSGVPYASAQSHEADPDAKKAFEDVVKAYRDHTAIRIDSTVTVGMKDDDAEHTAGEVKLEGVYGKGKLARFKLRDFICYVNAGTLSFIHDGNPQSYFTIPDDGSPYYAIMNAFVDIPYPELAIMLGEDEVDSVIMQLHPKAPWIQPTNVKTIEEGEASLEEITFTSDFEDLEMTVDPKTHLIQTIDLKVTGGDLVRSGATLTYHHVYTYPDFDKPVDEQSFVFDPGARQRVDTLIALSPRPVAGAGPDEQEGGPQEAAGGLVGKPAPTFVLSTMDGRAIDLSELKGNVVVLDFWATWCPPCREALPLLHEVEQWRRKENLDVTIIPINVWEIQDRSKDTPELRKKQAQEFWNKKKFSLPVAMDYSDDVAKEYGVNGIPRTIIIGPDGIVSADHTGLEPNYIESMKAGILAARSVGKDQEKLGNSPKPNQ